jgi:hypothetical protein
MATKPEKYQKKQRGKTFIELIIHHNTSVSLSATDSDYNGGRHDLNLKIKYAQIVASPNFGVIFVNATAST